jgi:hypothetical protein
MQQQQQLTLPKISSRFMPPIPPPSRNNNIINLIKSLPVEIKNKIYKEYFEPEVYFMQYKRVIESKESQSLGFERLLTTLPIILSKKNVISYISKKCKYFASCYQEHKIHNNKTFILMSNGESLAASILMYMYH